MHSSIGNAERYSFTGFRISMGLRTGLYSGISTTHPQVEMASHRWAQAVTGRYNVRCQGRIMRIRTFTPMMRSMAAVAGAVLALASAILLAGPSVFPTGTTIYDPARAWNGFTVLSPLGTEAAIVIDMNGNVVKRWEGFNNSAGGPSRVFPGGTILGPAGANPPRQESLELVRRDFEGNVLWRFDQNERIETRDGKMISSLRQHHDWQRTDFPAGYYSPESNPGGAGSNMLILTHTN